MFFCAINGTTIEVTFNRAPGADETLTYTVAGTEYTPTMDGAVATLTVPQMVDDTAYAVVVNDGTNDLYNADVTYDKNEPTTLTIKNVDMSQTVGEDFNLVVELVDEDGDVIANKELTLNITPSVAAPNNDSMVLTATTDENGLATFTWTRLNPDTTGESLDAYVNERPVVRVAGTVEWLTTLKLVSVDNMTEQTLGLGTPVEYVVIAKNADGSVYTNNLGVKYTGTAATDATIVGQYKNADGNWTDFTAGELDAYENSIALTAANTGTDGQITCRFYSNNGGTTDFQPIFFQDTNTNNTMETDEARIVGGTVNYVAQVPTFTWTPENSVTIIATTQDPNDATNTDHTKKYTLKAVDQYGNPFRGIVKIYEYKAADNAALTTPATAVDIAVDLNNDGDYTDASENALNPTSSETAFQSIDFALGTGVVPEASGDTITILVGDDTAETVKLVAFYDNTTAIDGVADVTNAYDANDNPAFTDELTFAARTPTTITASKITEADEIAVGASADYLFTVKDQFGSVCPTADKTVVAEVSGTNLGTIVIDSIDGSYDAQTGFSTTTDNNITVNAVKSGKDAVTGVTENGYLAVRIDSGSADNQATLRLWIDTDDNGDFTPDEINATITTAKYVAPVVTSGEITGQFAVGNIVGPAAANAAKGSGYEFVGEAGVTATNELQVKYTLKDQDGQDYDATGGAVAVKWTIVNNGSTGAKYGDSTNPSQDIAAGETKTITINSTAANPGVSTLYVGSVDATTVADLTVTAEIVDKADSAKSVKVAYVLPANAITSAANPTNQVISGTIVGLQKDGDNDATVADNDGTIITLVSSFGDLYTITIPTGAWANAGKLTIDGASVPGESQLENETYGVKIGQNIKLTFDATGTNYYDGTAGTGDEVAITN